MQKKKLSKFANFFIAYGEYHDNKTNKIFHLISIPLISFTFMILLQFIPISFFFKNTLFEINLITPFLIIHIYIFLQTNILAGSLTILWNSIFFFIGRLMFLNCLKKGEKTWLFSLMLVLHIFAWIFQVLGHIFEKRAPALMDNLALMSNAPFFVTCEVLRDLGWKKEEFVEIDKVIKEKIRIFREKKKNN